MTAWPSAGLLSEDHWTESEQPPTKTTSDTSTSKGELSLVPLPDDYFTNEPFGVPGHFPGTAPTTAPIASPGSPPVNTPEVGTSADVCIACRNRPRRKIPGAAPTAHSKHCEMCAANLEAHKLCMRCGAEKSGQGRSRGKLCTKCRLVPFVKPSKRSPCRGCGGKKPPTGSSPFCLKCQAARKVTPVCLRCQVNPRRKESGARLCTQCKDGRRERQKRYHREYFFRQQEKKRWFKEQEVSPTNHRSHTEAEDAHSFPALPAEQLARKIEQLIKMERGGPYDILPKFTGETGNPMKDNFRSRVCVRLCISEKALGNWTIPNRTVDFDIADDVLRHAGWNWIDVWDGTETCDNGQTVEEVFESTELTVGLAA